MARQRISTSVDREQLERARLLAFERDSELFDAALDALIDREQQRREVAALSASPYRADDELDLGPPTIDWDRELPYDGDIPAEVIEAAKQRRSPR